MLAAGEETTRNGKQLGRETWERVRRFQTPLHRERYSRAGLSHGSIMSACPTSPTNSVRHGESSILKWLNEV